MPSDSWRGRATRACLLRPWGVGPDFLASTKAHRRAAASFQRTYRSRPARLRWAIVQAAAVAYVAMSVACAPLPATVSAELVWSTVAGDEIPVAPGDVLRVESREPLRVVEVFRSLEGDAEVSRTVSPTTDGVVFVRASLGASAVRLPGARAAHLGVVRQPEIAWFDLETKAMAWAKSPLGTPFPVLAAAPRLEPADFSDLDAVLREEGVDADASDALRSFVALRAVRALEGMRSYPYARNEELTLDPVAKTRDIDERTFAELVPDHPLTVTTSGPGALVVSGRAIRSPVVDATAEVRVVENRHVRGVSRGVVRGLNTPDPAHPVLPSKGPPRPGHDDDDPTLALLRQVFVPVPPGRHTYRIEASGASTWVAAMRTSAFLRLEDGLRGNKSEAVLSERGARVCERPNASGACAIALALGGKDEGATFERAMVAASERARRLATRISGGAPADRASVLEAEASVPDPGAISALGRDAAATIDGNLRDAWWRGTSRATSWETIDDGAEPTWFAFLPREHVAATCAGGGGPKAPSSKTGEIEVGGAPSTLHALPWRRVRAVRLLAVAPCSAEGPIQLEVDGQLLNAQPSGGRSLWHIVVKGETARVRRIDEGAGHVYVLSDDTCSDQGFLVHPAAPLTEPRELVFPARVSAPGVEVWLKEGSPQASFAVDTPDGRIDVTARAGAGLVAVDPGGVRWKRASYVALPASATRHARVSGPPDVAVRAVARAVKGALETKLPEHAAPPNVEALVAVSRELVVATTRRERAKAAFERAVLLATYGAERASLEDADLAKSFGATGPEGEDPVAYVRRSILPMPPTPLELKKDAYGIESDFDPDAKRCNAKRDGPRARIAALDERLRVRAKNAPFDRALAVEALAAALVAPDDPRSDSMSVLATTSSRWQGVREVDGGGGRVPRPRENEKEKNPILDADGRLRSRIHAGDPFGDKFVTVTPDRRARAFLADIDRANAHLDIVCVPRRATSPKDERCPLKIVMGQQIVDPPKFGSDVRARVELPPGHGRGKNAELEVSLDATPADYIATLRVVFDRPTIGSTEVPGVGWVLDTPPMDYRYLVAPRTPIRLHPKAPGLLRIDALSEPDTQADVFVTIDGRTSPLVMDGTPKMIPVLSKGEIVVSARNGSATVAIAERNESESRAASGEVDAEPTLRQLDLGAARSSLEHGAWRDVAERSQRPLTWLEERLGTLESNTGVNLSNYRDGSRLDTSLDAYGYESLTYRRRIESINLSTLASGLVRARDGAPTYGAATSVYEDVLHFRASGAVGLFEQDVNGHAEYTLRPRAFLEYSGRLAPDLFVLPRLGYDGYYTTLDAKPASTKNVDDEVYNAFRKRRSTFAFLQGLLWYVPFFNDIFYLRVRGTYDATHHAFSHASFRPGTFLIFRALELSVYGDAQYYAATDGVRNASSVDAAAGGGALLHLPVTPGSFEIRPGVSGLVRADGSYSVWGGVTLAASFRRGARDYSSLELSYPEETSGGIPWRNDAKGP